MNLTYRVADATLRITGYVSLAAAIIFIAIEVASLGASIFDFG